MTNKNLNNDNSDEEIVRTALERFHKAVEAEFEIRKEAAEDLKFSAGEQWPTEVKVAREQDRRPCLTINRLPQFIRQITNDQRQNRPAIKVSPVDDKADVETAKIHQGLIRHIEYSSNADTAYDTAFDSAVRSSFGFFRILTEYCDPMSFDQEIRIKRVPDRFSCYLDPAYQEPDGSDATWGFIYEDITIDEFRAKYPDADLSNHGDFGSITNKYGDWLKPDTVRVAEYFYKSFEEKNICLLNTGEVVEKEQLPEVLPEGLEIKSERKTITPSVKWCKLTAHELLEKTDWPGQYIPIVPVLGEEIIIEGKRQLVSVVRYAKDPQRMLNYWKSAETETIALAPRAPFIAPAGTFEGFEDEWSTANIRNHAYLEYNPKLVGGQPAGPPQRNVYEPPVQAITQASLYAADDLKATTGIYDAGLGAQSNEKSGIAIQRRNMQSQTSNFHFFDNLSKSIRHGGRIILDLIPHIYDTARAARILGEDGNEEIVQLNQFFERNGKAVAYNMGVGKYDVTVDTGPSFETKRQEAVATQSDLARSYPKLYDVAGDIVIGNMDIPGSKEIAERIKKTLPPGIADDANQKQQPLPPQIQQQMNQMNQMIEQLTTQLNQAHDVLDTKKMDLESRERIALDDNRTKIEIAMLNAGSRESIILLQEELAGIKHRLSMVNYDQPIESEINEGAGQQMAMAPDQDQQPTGGQSPGQPMGV